MINGYLLSHRMRQTADELLAEGLRQQQVARALADCGCARTGRRSVAATAEALRALFGLHHGRAGNNPAGC